MYFIKQEIFNISDWWNAPSDLSKQFYVLIEDQVYEIQEKIIRGSTNGKCFQENK